MTRPWSSPPIAAWVTALSFACSPAVACALDTRLEDERPAVAGVTGDAGAMPESSPPGALAPATPDVEPPRIDAVAFEPAADCVRVRFVASEPIAATVAFVVDGERHVVALASGVRVVDAPVRPAVGLAGRFGEAIVAATDASGLISVAAPVGLRLPAAGGSLVITEVLANPAGAEATQEWVEIRNTGTTAVALAGHTLADDSGADRLPDIVLPAGARALLVPAAFEPGAADVAPRPSTILVRVEGRLGADGLANTGERIELRTPTGVVASRHGGWTDTSAAAWTGRSVQRRADDACDHPGAWTEHPGAPTPGW